MSIDLDTKNENSNKIGMPVVLPLLLVIILTISMRLGTVLQKSEWLIRSSANTESRHNQTEQTYLQYAEVNRLLEQKNDKAVLSCLGRLKNAPITLSGSEFKDETIQARDPRSVLLGVGVNLVNRATELKQSGNDGMAKQYIQALHGIGNGMMRSRISGKEDRAMALHFQEWATKTEAKLYPDNINTRAIVANIDDEINQML